MAAITSVKDLPTYTLAKHSSPIIQEEKVKVKREFLRMITRMELTSAKTRFIIDFFEKYLILNELEEEVLMAELRKWMNQKISCIYLFPGRKRE